MICPSRMLKKNLGCFGVVVFEVLILSPFVLNTVAHGSCRLARCAGYLSLTQSRCHRRWSGPPKEPHGAKEPARGESARGCPGFAGAMAAMSGGSDGRVWGRNVPISSAKNSLVRDLHPAGLCPARHCPVPLSSGATIAIMATLLIVVLLKPKSRK